MNKFNSIAAVIFVVFLIFILSIMTKPENTPVDQVQPEINFDEISQSQQVPLELDSQESVQVVFETSKGDIKADLYPNLVPETVKNFLELAKADKYDGVIFHRVIKNFMIQTGDFENFNGTGGHSYLGEGTNIDEEFHPKLKHVYGALSMAKTPAPSTTGSQFFIVQNQAGTPHLDNAHSVFGMVQEGMDIVEEIANSQIGPQDNPLEEIKILDVTIKD